jgi:hypothetical protein
VYYGFAALKLSKITVPGFAPSMRHVPAFNSNVTALSGTLEVFHASE